MNETKPAESGAPRNARRCVIGLMLATLIAGAGCASGSRQTALVGPNGGDIVSIKSGSAYAEVMADADTGNVSVRTLDKDLTPRAIEKEPITVGSGSQSMELTPRPTETDAPGTSSRFEGQAEWMRGGSVRHGWMQGRSTGDKQEFEWKRGWEAGRMHATEMGGRGAGGPMQEHGPRGGMMGR